MPNPHDFHAPQSAYAKSELLSSGAGGYFGPGNAQLPAPPMLMMDRITRISLDGGEYDNGLIVGELDISPDLWFFGCHFPGDPVMPGCLGLDAMWQMIGYWLGWSGSPGKGRAVGVGEVKFKGAHYAGDEAGALRGQHAPGQARPARAGHRGRPGGCGRSICLHRQGYEGWPDTACAGVL